MGSDQVYDSCEKYLHWNAPMSAADSFRELADYCESNQAEPDIYGEGEFLQRFEQQVADHLGMAAGLFFVSGVMAQQTALRCWAEKKQSKHVAFHPTTHMELNEFRAYDVLQDLRGHLIGDPLRPTLAKDVQAVGEKLSSVLIEVPNRHLGGMAPSWQELQELKDYCRARDIALHLDGARLWEVAPYYDKSYRQIAQGFDSVYVSFYKGLGALPGAMLLGSAELIEEAKVWRKRMGGTLYQLHPLAASAKLNFDQKIECFPELHEKAKALAMGLNELPGVRTLPTEPHANMMHIFVDATPEDLAQARDRIAEKDRIWLTAGFKSAKTPGWSSTELYLTPSSLEVSTQTALSLFAEMFESSLRKT